MTRRLDYICMQPTREGQASHAHVHEIVRGLRVRGWDVRLVTPPLPSPGRLDGVRRLAAAATAQLRYWRDCRLRPARFVYVRAHFLTAPSVLLARLAGSTVVLEINGASDDVYDAWPRLRLLGGLLAGIGTLQVRAADAVIAVTDGLVEYTRARTGRQDGYHVIGNGANVDMFRPAASSPGQGGRPYVLFLGALASWQGLDTVLEAAASSVWPPGVDLVVAGDGRERWRVEAAASAHPHVRWLGVVPYREAPGLVAGSLASLVPMGRVARSRHGLSPLKLYEAMACGVPVIASDLPGLGDTVRRHGCGLLFEPGDATMLACRAAEMAADPESARSMGLRGRVAAVSEYSWQSLADRTGRVLLEARRARR